MGAGYVYIMKTFHFSTHTVFVTMAPVYFIQFFNFTILLKLKNWFDKYNTEKVEKKEHKVKPKLTFSSFIAVNKCYLKFYLTLFLLFLFSNCIFTNFLKWAG